MTPRMPHDVEHQIILCRGPPLDVMFNSCGLLYVIIMELDKNNKNLVKIYRGSGSKSKSSSHSTQDIIGTTFLRPYDIMCVLFFRRLKILFTMTN
jgi:high-affinity Fe2+/Pb2+ permease